MLLHAMFMYDWNNRQSDKKEVLTNNQDMKKYNSMKHFKRPQLLFTKTSFGSKVSLKILSHE